MKKVFGYLLVILGVICLPSCFSISSAEMVGRLLGNALITFLPAYFLLRDTKKRNDQEKK